MSKVKVNKVNLDLLKKLVLELENSISMVDELKSSSTFDKDKYLIELAKASGLCSGIFQESGLLMADIQSCSLAVSSSNEALKTELTSLMTSLKSNGSN